MQKPEMPEDSEVRLQKLGIRDFVGAATDGKYGTVAFDFQSPHDPLIARKSWFFFDDEYVCLGAGISCKSRSMPVSTTLNQCLLRGDVIVSSNGENKVIDKGEKEYENVNWIYQDNVGYIFPEPSSVHIKNSEATGSWWRINRQTDSPKGEIKLDVFKAWIDHGKRASEESYAYIVVPSASVEELEQNKSKNNIVILKNTPEVQAVKHLGLKMCQAVFYKAGEIQISGDLTMRCETPGIVILKANSKGMELTVSDPNRELGKMYLSVSSKIEKGGENFTAVWNDKKKQTELIIDLAKGHYAGSSITVEL
jgi:chondroitin AC lyase